MKISCLPWGILSHCAHTAEIYSEWFQFAAQNDHIEGVDPIDNAASLFGAPARKQESRALRPVLRDLGLKVVMFVTHTDFRVEKIPPKEQDRIKFLVEQAVYFDSLFFRVLTGIKVPGELFQERVLENVLAGLRWVSALTREAGLPLILENHHETTDEMLLLCESLAGKADPLRPLAGHCLNCEIKPPFRYGMDPNTFVKRLAPFASNYHIDNFVYDPNGWDADRTGRKLERAIPVHKGEIDIRAILEIIKESGFDGWLSIEYGGRVASFDHIAESAAYLRETWDALKPAGGGGRPNPEIRI